MTDEILNLDIGLSDIKVRDASRREIEVRLLPWDTTIETTGGPEEFARGAFADTADDGVMLMGLEHEAHIGIGQGGEPRLTALRGRPRVTTCWPWPKTASYAACRSNSASFQAEQKWSSAAGAESSGTSRRP